SVPATCTRCATTRSTPTASAMPSRPPRLLPSWKGPTSMVTATFGLRRTRRRVPLCSADRDPASVVQTWSGGPPYGSLPNGYLMLPHRVTTGQRGPAACARPAARDQRHGQSVCLAGRRPDSLLDAPRRHERGLVSPWCIKQAVPEQMIQTV